MAPAAKPMTLLRRPSASASPSGGGGGASSALADRIGDAIRQAVEGALDRERVRVHALYMSRQEALLKALAALLCDGLAPHIAAAAAREAAALADAVRRLPAAQASAGEAAKAIAEAAEKGPDPAEVEAVRQAFKGAFEQELLGVLEKGVAGMLAGVAGVVDGELEAKVAKPVGDRAIGAMRVAADAVAADKAEFESVMKAAKEGGVGAEALEMATPVNPEDAVMSEVVRALSEGRVREALEMGLRGSYAVRAKALSGALDSGVAPEEVLGLGAGESSVTTKEAYAAVIAVLASDMSDRTGIRLAWLMEATMNLDDAPHRDGDPGTGLESSLRHLEAAVGKLKDMSLEGDVTPADIKQAKMLVRCLKVTVKSLKG